MRKLFVSLLSLMMVVALAMPTLAQEDDATKTSGCQAVETEDKLLECLNAEDSGEIVIKNQIAVAQDSLDGKGKTVYVEISDDAESYARSALYLTKSTEISNITIESRNNEMKYGIHIQSNGGELKLNNVDIKDYTFAGVNLSGAKFNGNLSASTVNGGYAAIELSMGSGITIVPVIENLVLTSEQPVYADIEQISQKVANDTDKVNSVIENIKNVSPTNYLYKDQSGLDQSGTFTTVDSLEGLEAAVANEQNTIYVSKPISIGKEITLDLNGKTVEASPKFVEDTSQSGGSKNMFNVVSGVTATIKNGTLKSNGLVKNILSVTASSNVSVEGITFDHGDTISGGGAPIIVNNSTVTLNDTNGFILGDGSWYAINVDPKGGNSQLNVNGTVNVTDNSSTKNKAIIYVEGVSANNAGVNLNATFTNSGNGAVVATDNTTTTSDVVTVNGGNAVINGDGTVTIKPSTPTPEKPRPTYRPSSPSKDLPSNTKECQKEFGDEYIWSDEYDACVIKFMIVDTSTR